MSTAKLRDPSIREVLRIIERSGLSARQIDRRKGVTPSTLRNWRSGKTQRPMNLSIEQTLRACGYKRVIMLRGSDD